MNKEDKKMGWELVARGPISELEELWRFKTPSGWVVKQYGPGQNISICFVPSKNESVNVNILDDH